MRVPAFLLVLLHAIVWNIALSFVIKRPTSLALGLSTRIESVRDTISIPDLKESIPRKVLVLVEPTPFNYVSGYANRFQEMLKYLHRAGDEVEIVTADSDPKHPHSFLDYNITTNRGFSMALYPQVTITFDFARSIPRLIRRFRPDIIHVSTPSAIIFAATLWAKWFSIPLVMSYHTDLVNYIHSYLPYPGIAALGKWLVRFFLKRADLVLCTSPQLQEQMKNLGVQNVDVWRKGINTERFNPRFKDSAMRSALSGGNSTAPLLLYVGRLGAEKKIDRLKAVLDANPGCRLALVGKGPAESELRKVFANYPVHFAGQLVGDELSRAFASADVFVMPSDTETLGFVVIEALASAVPVVGVRAGGLPDIIEDNVTGFLVENDPQMAEFSERVRELVNKAELRSQFSKRAVAWAQQWSWEAATSVLRNVQYPKALARHRARCESN